MRRFTSFIGITLLAFLVSGWGNVLAVGLCPHSGRASKSSTVEKASAHHQAMDGMEMTPAPAAQHCGSSGEVAAFSQPAGTCAHCISQSESPTTLSTSRELTLKKRDAGAIVEQASTTQASLAIVFTPKFIPTQHAPPGPSNRKHLLLGVFLI